MKEIENAYQAGVLTAEILFSGKSESTPMTSLTFVDNNTAYIGSYGTKIPYFVIASKQ